MPDIDGPNLGGLLGSLAKTALGVKLGPGVLSTVMPVAIAGLLSVALIGWALSDDPWLALAGVALVGTLVAFLIERTFRYAEKNPIPALMGGAEILKLIEHQATAKDKSIITEDPPVVGGSINQIKLIESGDVGP